MLGRVDAIMTAREHRYRAVRKAGAMRRLIDAACQPGHDDKAGIGKIARQRLREF